MNNSTKVKLIALASLLTINASTWRTKAKVENTISDIISWEKNPWSINKDKVNNVIFFTEEAKKLEYLAEDIMQKTLQEDIEYEKFYNKKIADIKWSPLDMKWIKKSLDQFLWINQFELIMNKYNKDKIKYIWKTWKISTRLDDYKDKEIKIPLIYDELKPFLPDYLQDFLMYYPEFQKDIEDKNENIVIITRISTGKFIMAYYKKWKLFIATHVSPWLPSNKWKNTPIWTFYTKKDKQFIRKRSREFENSPMAYAIHITRWVFFHHWLNVDWKKRSHGCIRTPWFIQEALHSYLEEWKNFKVIIKHTDKT